MWLLLGGARIALKGASVKQVIDLSAALADPTTPQNTTVAAQAEAICIRASKWVPGVSCLHQATATRIWLGAHGVRSKIALGFRHRSGFEGHAWLELEDGSTLFEGERPFKEVLTG